MKKTAIIMLALVAMLLLLPLLAAAQKSEKAKMTYDTAQKVLYRTRTVEVVEVVDTVRLNAEKDRLVLQRAKLASDIDSLNAQIKEARRLLNKKKGNGNDRAAETPAPPILPPQKDAKPKTKTKTKN
jgi:cytochrome c-type biogenesis protein CcmH/NrfG